MDERTLLLERFHLALVASIERANPAYLREGFTVREIHEDLIPYRTHRDLIGVAMNGDYEDGLMRLLAGEGGYLTLETPEALSALKEELGGKAPDTGLFKEFPDAVVRLNPAMLGGPHPVEPRRGVLGLFREREASAEEEREASAEDPREGIAAAAPSPPQGPAGTNGWKLDDADSGEPRSEGRGTKADRPSPQAEGGPASDEVETPDRFWSGSGASAGEQGTPPAEDDGATEALEAENRRLKILLAERVLEVEELREKLDKRGARGRRNKP